MSYGHKEVPSAQKIEILETLFRLISSRRSLSEQKTVPL